MKQAKKIIITGAGGYIGSIATYIFLQNGYEVVALDNFSVGHREPLLFLQKKYSTKRLRFYDLDLNADLNPLFEKEKNIAAVVHYAALCKVDESMKEPYRYFFNNVCGTQNLLTALNKFGINKIVFSSTCAVYGEAEYIPVDEKHPTNPANPYGESKLMIEKLLKWYSELSDLKYVVLRYFNVCGASDDGVIGDSKKPSVLLVQNAVRGALGIEPFFLTCPQVATPDGTPIRDYINVVDLNLAHLKAIEYLLKEGNSETINLGTGTGSSVLEVVRDVQKVTGKEFKIGKSAARQGEYAKMIASIDKAKKILEWQPKHSLADSISSLVVWYKAHPKGWND